jgi:hypothetical protein
VSSTPDTEPTPAAVSHTTAPANGDELVRLRARVASLEQELAQTHARANAAIAAAQERAYWLDRWHVDLNALMQRPGAAEFRGLLRGLRAVFRALLRVRRALRR